MRTDSLRTDNLSTYILTTDTFTTNSLIADSLRSFNQKRENLEAGSRIVTYKQKVGFQLLFRARENIRESVGVVRRMLPE